MRITLETIPHEQQRLGALGDWFFEPNGDLVVRVSECGHWSYNLLALFHEMYEAVLCKHAGITTEMVDEDQLTQRDRERDDPESFSGYPGARLQNQHNDALAAEWVLSRLLGVDWQEYGAAFDKMGDWTGSRTVLQDGD